MKTRSCTKARCHTETRCHTKVRSGREGRIMPGDLPFLAVLVVLFVATLVRSSFGFGEALVAVPLLALILPIEVAAPLVAIVSTTVAAGVLLQDWSHVHLASVGRLVLSTLFGLPLGILLLTRVPEPGVKAILGGVILLFSVFSLMRPRRVVLHDDRRAWIFGFAAGILGGAYGMNGPPLVVYGAMRGWTPGQFRATLQGYFMPASLALVIAYWITGIWSAEVTRLYLGSIPILVAAVLIGRYINQRLDADRFLVYVYGGLILIALLLMAQAAGFVGRPIP